MKTDVFCSKCSFLIMSIVVIFLVAFHVTDAQVLEMIVLVVGPPLFYGLRFFMRRSSRRFLV